MNIVWEKGEVTVNDVVRIIGKKRPTKRTTIQTLLGRMKEKGWVTTRKVGQAFVYRPTRERSVSIRQKVHAMLSRYFEGSAPQLLNALLEDQTLTPEEANELRRVIDQAEKAGLQPGATKDQPN